MRARHQIELKLDQFRRAVIVDLRPHPRHAVAQAALQRSQRFPFQQVEWIAGRGAPGSPRTLRDDVVFWAGLEKNFAQVIMEARAKGYKVMIGRDPLASLEFVAIGGLSIEGVLMTMEGDPRRKHEAEAVTQKFTAKGFSPEAYAFNAYAAVQLIQQAAEIAHSIEPHAVAQALHSPRSFETVLGPLRFDKKGNLDKPNYIWYEYNSDGRHVSYRPYTPN